MSRQKRATKAAPSPDSQRSVRRANRGFVSLEVSSRKHRRALRRLTDSQIISGVQYPAGTKKEPDAGRGMKTHVFMHTAGGALRYH